LETAVAGMVPILASWLALAEAEAAPAESPLHFWIFIALLIAGAAILLMLGMFARYLRIAVNLFLDTPLPVTANLADYKFPEGEVVSFPSIEGRSLCGMFIDRPPALPDRGTILFCHEFGSDMRSAGRYAWPLVQAGYTVFTFDFRGHGKSFTPPHFEPRHWPSDHDVKDILAAVAYVQSRRDTAGRGLGILGISRGACAAVMAAAANPAVRCLAVDGVFSTDLLIDELMKRWVQIFVRVDLARADRTAATYRLFRQIVLFYVELKCRCRFPSTRRVLPRLEAVPVLFINGERDTYVPPEQTRTLYQLKPGPKDLWICPEARHNQAVATDPATYARRVTDFFDRHLGQTPAPARPASQEGRP
jgi:uncharacterized protein